MRVKHLSEQATAQFKERRRHWAQFAALSLDTLDLIERNGILTDAERIVLKEYSLHWKRERKAKLELIEKRADYLERAALPVAVTALSVVTWLLIELQASPAVRQVVQALTFLVCAVGWAYTRVIAFRRVADARKSLARLGKVD